MDNYMQKNQKLWDELTPIHVRSDFYDVKGFKAGKCTLKSIELEELGDVTGKSILHLQCHFGLDTLSWARLGADVTGVDFSKEAITLARSLSSETGIKAEFINSNIYDLPENLKGEFDIVFTSYGIICWLPNLERWSDIITRFLKPGGTFYMVENHPFMNALDDSEDAIEPRVIYPYFHSSQPEKYHWEGGSYAVAAKISHPAYEWTHTLSDIINALISGGMRIEFLHEFPVSCWKALPFMVEDEKGLWRIPGDLVPLQFSIKARKV